MTQGDSPPIPGVGGISARAAATAATLLEAYDAQDRRQAHIKTGNYETAKRQAERARTRMAETWVREFPDRGEGHAETAGRLFMDALFLQDEIENWAEIPATQGELSRVLVTTDAAREAKPPATDGRWTDVETLLDAAAVEVGIPGPFAAKQTQFWLRHGQRAEGWEEPAADAFELRLQAMLPGVDADDRQPLVSSFVEGVKLHDGWALDEGTADRSRSRELVGGFYQQVFDLRDDGG
jgi:hypothetical protein